MSRIALKDHIRETHLFTTRAVVALVVVAVVLLAITVRMVHLQVAGHEHYKTLSRNNRVSIVPEAPTRGLIFDRKGVILAQNLSAFSLEVVPERVADLEATLARLAELVEISDQDIARFRGRLKQKRRFQPTPLRLRLTEEEVARLAVNRHHFPGVEVNARLVRDYPLGALAVHAVGYVGRINVDELQRIDRSTYAATSHIGKLGVEQAYEAMLHGQVGYQHIETNAVGRTVRILERTPPAPGVDLVLTLDAALQKTAKQALGEENGAVVAIDPRNGEILVLASKGDYDPNLFVNGIDYTTYQALQASSSKPLFNRALRGQYPPGSTIKPFVGLAGLEVGEAVEGHAMFCPGWYSLADDDHRYRDWKKEGHGHTDLKRAIVESCDVYFYDLARRMGVNQMHDFLSPFGFGHKTGIDISGELAGLLPSTTWKRQARGEPWYLGETLIAGIGQGYMLATPLQLAVATAALSTGGKVVRPHLLKTPTLPVLTSAQPSIAKWRDEHWEYVMESMVDVVSSPHGTARRIYKARGYHIAGKTGTAQVFGIKQDEEYVAEEIAKKLRDHALFIAFAPVDDPRIAVAVVVENGGSGGSVAAPVAEAVIRHYLDGFSDGRG